MKQASFFLYTTIFISFFSCFGPKSTPYRSNTIPAARENGRDTLVEIRTKFGSITVVLFRETPVHRSNFLKLAKTGAYDSTTFHRIIKDFMIQGGDPNSKDADPGNDGLGSFGKTLPAEFNPSFSHVHGALAAARSNNPEKRSSDCQFYLVENANGTHFLDQNYTVFGQTIRGFDVISTISMQAKSSGNRPISNIRMGLKLLPMKEEKVTEVYGYDYKTHSLRK